MWGRRIFWVICQNICRLVGAAGVSDGGVQFVPVNSGAVVFEHAGGLAQTLLAVLPSEAVQPFKILVTGSVGGQPGSTLGVDGALMTPLADGSDFVFQAQPIVVPKQGAQL